MGDLPPAEVGRRLPIVGSASESQQIEKVVERLTDRFPDTSPIEIATVVNEEHLKLAEAARIRDFIPVLVEHEARNRLRRRGQVARRVEPQDSGAPPYPEVQATEVPIQTRINARAAQLGPSGGGI
jgi:hypothetical protein